MNGYERIAATLVVISAGLLVACPPGTKTTFDAAIKVSKDTCQEDRTAPPNNETVTLDCHSVEGSGSVTIIFPRREWTTIRFRDLGADAGPGK